MQYIGYDSSGIARVYGTHDNADLAESMCKDEAMEYIKHRPDTGPLDKWSFKCFASHAERRRYEGNRK
jgi:hypothetical protein